MQRRIVFGLMAVGMCCAAGISTVAFSDPPPGERPVHKLPPAPAGKIVVGLCDGETTALMDAPAGERPTRQQAQAVVDQLMAEWRRKNPNAQWDEPVQLAQAPPATAQQEPGDVKQKPASQPLGKGADEGAPEAGQRIEQQKDAGERAAQGETSGAAGGKPAAPQGPVQEGHTYGAFSERDQQIWQASLDQFIAEGKRVFHSAEALGGTIGVSCDMCHPDAANTHPETYPKYQVQFQRVALLRDMINWCIENPMRGRPLPDDDPRLKAMEGYILAQRKSVLLEYGKH